MPAPRKFFPTLVLALQLIAFPVNAQLPIYWSKNIGGSDNDNRAIMQLTPDGGSILLGNCKSSDGDLNFPGHGGTEIVIMKMDRCGNMQWKKKYGGSGSDLGYSLILTPDGGYAFGGMTDSKDGDVSGVHGNAFDWWIVKIDATGAIQWKRTIGGSNTDIGGFIAAHSNGNIIVLGHTTSTDGDLLGVPAPGNASGPTGVDAWVTCLDNTGNTLWQKKVGTTGSDVTGQVIISPDGAIVACGTTPANASLPSNLQFANAWVFKMDINTGNIIWNKNFGGSKNEGAYTITANASGELIVGGSSTSSDGDVTVNYGDADAWLLKLSSAGDLLWQLPIGGTSMDRSWDVAVLPDQSVLLCGQTFSTDASFLTSYGQDDAFFACVSNSGQLLWKQHYGGSLSDILFNIRPLNENVFMASGISGSSDHDLTGNQGLADLWLVKFKVKPLVSVDTAICQGSMINNTIIMNDTTTLLTFGDVCGYDSSYKQYTITAVQAIVHSINDTVITAGQSVTLFTTWIGNISWNANPTLSCLNCNNPVATPAVTTEYIVKVQQGLCMATDTVKITVEGKNEIYVPSAFSPNDDGLNDIFKATGSVQNFNMKVYNRWGNLVFYSRNITIGWNGYYKGKKQPAGDYVYLITYNSLSGKQKLLKGNLLLVK